MPRISYSNQCFLLLSPKTDSSECKLLWGRFLGSSQVPNFESHFESKLTKAWDTEPISHELAGICGGEPPYMGLLGL